MQLTSEQRRTAVAARSCPEPLLLCQLLMVLLLLVMLPCLQLGKCPAPRPPRCAFGRAGWTNLFQAKATGSARHYLIVVALQKLVCGTWWLLLLLLLQILPWWFGRPLAERASTRQERGACAGRLSSKSSGLGLGPACNHTHTIIFQLSIAGWHSRSQRGQCMHDCGAAALLKLTSAPAH